MSLVSHISLSIDIFIYFDLVMMMLYCSHQADDAAAAAGYDNTGASKSSRRRLPSVDEVDYDDVPRTASRLAASRTPESPTGSGQPQIVALNETGRGPSRIGATLYQAPSPHSGFTATQNVVSSSAVRPGDVDQVSVVVVVLIVLVVVVVVIGSDNCISYSSGSCLCSSCSISYNSCSSSVI